MHAYFEGEFVKRNLARSAVAAEVGPHRSCCRSIDEETRTLLLASLAQVGLLFAGERVVPPLPIAGMPEPLAVFMDFDAKTVDAMLERLSILRSRMLPPMPAPNKRN
jgi:hypothetical protein